MFKVESGVRGAMRINVRLFGASEDAEAYAARIRRSNSTGDYWAEVTETCACGEHPVAEYGTRCPSCPRTRVYFRVPNFTGYGEDFDTWAEALTCATSKFHSEFVSVCIDVREEDEQGDRLVKRYDVPNPLAVQCKDDRGCGEAPCVCRPEVQS